MIVTEIMGVKGKPDIIERKRLQWYGHVRRMPEETIPKLIMEWIPGVRRRRGLSRKTWVEGVKATMTTRHLEPDRWRNRGMAFGLRKTAVKNTGWMDGWMEGRIDRRADGQTGGRVAGWMDG
jgi:hypothetical protein